MALRASAQQKGAHGRRLAETNGGNGRPNVLHGVINGEAGRHAATGRVYVQRYGFGRILGFEEEELGDYRCGEYFFDFAVQGYDALFQQAGKDVG